MTLIIAAGYSQANLFWQAVGSVRPSEVTLGFKEDAPSNATSQAIAVYNAATISGSVAAAGMMNNSWTFLGVRVMLMTESGPTIGEKFTTVTGSLGSTPVPINTAVLIRKTTSLGGRKNRGRMFVPPCSLPEANVDQMGVINSTSLTSLQTQWTLFYNSLTGADLEPKLFHTSDPVATQINAFNVQSVCATQRRRMRK